MRGSQTACFAMHPFPTGFAVGRDLAQAVDKMAEEKAARVENEKTAEFVPQMRL